MPDRFVSEPLELPAHGVEADFVRADLQFHGVDHSGLSYEARVFLNQPDADLETPPEPGDKGGYAGSFHVFGHGGCFGDVGHCDVPTDRNPNDRRLPHPLTPHTKTVIVTEQLRRLRDHTDTGQLTVTVVADVYGLGDLPVGRDASEPLLFDSISLVTYETPPALPPVSTTEAERPAPEPQ
jgi:tyrosinase